MGILKPDLENAMMNHPSMNLPSAGSTQAVAFDLRYRSLFDDGRGYTFPCDAQGRVDLDQLSPSARLNYLYVRAMVGRDFATPAVMLH